MSRFGACILSCDGPRLTADEKALFRAVQPFGFILFARHIETPDQVRALCAEFREAVGRECLITVDQEGGRVQRLRGPHWREWLPAETHEFLKNRCYGTDPGQIAKLGRAVADGLLDGGVLPVMKHMPGHGRANLDTHKDLPHLSAPLGDLTETDFAPFRALNDLPMGMTAHIVFDAIDDAPATQSPAVIGLIRERIGFDGLLMTDDISMGALSGSLAQRSRASLDAGCDVILHCNDDFAARVEVADAAGEMSDAAQARAQAAMTWRKPPQPIDIPVLEADLEALLDGRVYV